MTASSSIAPIINALPRTTRLSEYWQWWTGELRALIPQRLMNWVVGDVAVTDMMIEASGVTLIHSVSGKATTSAVIPFAETATHPLLAELRTKGQGQVRVLLGADQVLQKRISLPAAIEENLREVMGFELDRHTPFVASQAYYDVKLLRRDPQRDVIDVLLAVAARAVVDPLLAAVRQAGLSVEGITVVVPIVRVRRSSCCPLGTSRPGNGATCSASISHCSPSRCYSGWWRCCCRSGRNARRPLP